MRCLKEVLNRNRNGQRASCVRLSRESRQTTYRHLIQVWSEVTFQCSSAKQKSIKTDAAYLNETGLPTTVQGILIVFYFQDVFFLCGIETASEDTFVNKTSFLS